MTKKVRNSFIFALLIAVSSAACTTEESAAEEQRHETSPYSLTAVIPGATTSEVLSVLAEYIHERDDRLDGLPDRWIVAGTESLEPGAHPSEAAMNLPNETKLLEVCNHTYAGQAMSFGGAHGVALPCKIAIVPGEQGAKVYLLNPEGIFSAFFRDIPDEYAAGMAGLAATVRQELEGIIVSALGSMTSNFPKEDIGPAWDEEDLGTFATMDYSVEFSINIPEEHRADDSTKHNFKEEVLWAIMETLTYVGQEGIQKVGSGVPGLSVGDWHAARPAPVSLPGDVSLISKCSPTYAGAALSTGLHHAPALPCRSAVWVEGNKVHVHLLDPGFMFPVFFADVDREYMESMGEMADAVRSDLTLIIETAIAPFM